MTMSTGAGHLQPAVPQINEEVVFIDKVPL